MSEKSTESEEADGFRIDRRVLNVVGGLGILSFFGAMLTPVKDLAVAATDEGEVRLAGQRLVFAEAYSPEGGSKSFDRGEVVTVDAVDEPPESVLVVPEELLDSNQYLIRLQRLEEGQIRDPTNLDWVDEGFVAYSAICTHLGCTVGWEESDTEPPNVPSAEQEGASMLCPCHLSSFDPYQGAAVSGGPASRPVPQIGVEVADNGEIRLTSEFEGNIGSG